MVETYNITFKERIKLKYKEFKLYCYTSFVSAILMFFLLYFFTSILKFYYLLSLVILNIFIITISFILNKIYVFDLFNPKKLLKQYYHFFIVSIGAFVVNFISLYILVDFLGMWYLLSQAIIAVFGLPILFLIHKRFVFSYH